MSARFDEVGLFWQDYPVARGSARTARVMPPIPDTGWHAPKEFPNLACAKVLALDTECYDPRLTRKLGPGWACAEGHIVGVSLATDDRAWYFPVRHTIRAEDNMDPDKVFSWLRDTLSDNRPKIGANLIYDIGWLEEEGVKVRGELFDVQYAEALLSEAASVDLDSLAARYLGEQKETSTLYQWSRDYYGGKKYDQRENIYRCPPTLVGPYAEQDARLPFEILKKQAPLLAQQELYPLFRRECAFIRLLIAMRQRGVRVDVERAELVKKKVIKELERRQKTLDNLAGMHVDINRAVSIAQAYDAAGLKYTRTAKSKQPSFTKASLKNNEHPIPQAIVALRELTKIHTVFIDGYILKGHVNGRLHCSFHPLRGTDNGTRSGRLSSSSPNLQNIPSRDEILGPLVRGLFIPDEHYIQWRKMDASQIEYRMLAHYAVGMGAAEVRRAYKGDRTTDYHKLTQQLIFAKTGIQLERKPTKTINFGLLYGMGEAKLCRELGLSRDQGRELFDAYHQGAPFVRETMTECERHVNQLGYITTILGRRSRFDMWTLRATRGQYARPMPYEEALHEYGPGIVRSATHKALNRRLQGSAADLLKEAMLQCWEGGLFDAVGVPPLTVHDELDWPDPGGMDREFAAIKECFEHAIPLRVPLLVDEEIGPNWGNVKQVA